MRRWADVAEVVRATRKTSEKVASVADYLRSLESADLGTAVVFLSGRPFPERDLRTTGLGWSAIAAAALAVAGAGPDALSAAYDRSSDLGTAVGELLAAAGHQTAARDPAARPRPTSPPPSSRSRRPGDARRSSRSCEGSSSAAIRSPGAMSPRSCRGELRIGLREGHLEAGIASAFGRELATVQWAGMLTGDVGATAELARRDALDSARLALFHPLKVMLASPVVDEAEALARLPPPVWVEDKYDGIRAQLHKQGTEVRLYSRDLRDVTGQFPEVVAAAAAAPWDGILDGELLAWRDGAALPFLQLQARLGRKSPRPEILAEIPVIYVAFDALALRRRQRRDRAAAAAAPARAPAAASRRSTSRAPPASVWRRSSPSTTRRCSNRSSGAPRSAATRGSCSRTPTRSTRPGAAATPGSSSRRRSRRSTASSSASRSGTAVATACSRTTRSRCSTIDPTPPAGALVTIGKAYSGLTDVEIATMTRWFEEHTLSKHGRYRVVEPTVVVEIAFDVIHRSNRHASGFALRFPRIVRIRDDKTAADIDRLSTVAALHDRLAEAGRYGVLTDGPRAMSEDGSVSAEPA